MKAALWTELIPLGLLAFAALYGYLNLGRLPERVPIHFNAAGEPDNWMGKHGAIWLAPGIGLAFWVALLVIPLGADFAPYAWTTRTLFSVFMLNVQIVTVLYATDRLKAPLLGLLPAILVLLGYVVWLVVSQGLSQTKGT